MINKKEKYLEYASVIMEALSSMFDEDSEWCIDQQELHNGDNMTHFMHALANVVPTSIYIEMVGDNKNWLEFNHLANGLCFQYMNRVNEKEE